jgi:ABC-2 type transport system permease protein
MKSRLAWHVFTLEVRTLLNYRVDFWVNWLVGTAAQLAVAWFLWEAIFSYTEKTEIGGFTQKAMMLYYTLAVLADRAVHGQGSHVLSTDIYEGSLNRYLVYPLSLFRYKLMQNWAHTLFAVSQGMLLYAGFALIFGLPAGSGFSATNTGLALLSLMAGSALYLGMTVILEQVAFWADNVWSLNVLLSFVLRLAGGVVVPLSLFPPAAQLILEWLPFAGLVSLPIRTLMGQVGPGQWLQGMAVMAAWMVLSWSLAVLIWKRGTMKYSGVGI